MPTYLEAAVTDIQPYIARTPGLAMRRGASWMITRATSEAEVKAWIRDADLRGVELGIDAGHADGVITLTVPDGTAASHATQLLLHLRNAIPGAQLEASWGPAATYIEFRRGQPRDDQSLKALPPASDFPLAETCGFCRLDACDKASRMCADCAARAAVRGYGRAGPRSPGQEEPADVPDALGTERLLIEAVSQAVGHRLQPVRDLGELAKLGDESGNRNHVATVALDGNGMHGFFDRLIHEGDTSLKQHISPEISAATRSTLISAAQAVTQESDHRLAVIPHVLGGDDVVVSVTADRAWQFTLAFLEGFSAAITAAAGRLELPGELQQRLPSMSAGVVFAHAKFPYARAVYLAADVLRRAKRDTQGAEPAIGWLDVTADGEALPAWRITQTVAALRRQGGDIAALGTISRSGRQALARLLARGIEEESRAAALSWARRNSYPVVAVLLNQASVSEVRNLVALTRWWRS